MININARDIANAIMNQRGAQQADFSAGIPLPPVSSQYEEWLKQMNTLGNTTYGGNLDDYMRKYGDTGLKPLPKGGA